VNRDLEGVDFVNSTKLIHTLEDCIDYATERGGQSLDLLRHIAAHGTAWEAATRRETEARAPGELDHLEKLDARMSRTLQSQ
jgi:hypothetical protein